MPVFIFPGRAAKGQRPSGPPRLNRVSPRARQLIKWLPLNGLPTDLTLTAGTYAAKGHPLLGLSNYWDGSSGASFSINGLADGSPYTMAVWLVWTGANFVSAAAIGGEGSLAPTFFIQTDNTIRFSEWGGTDITGPALSTFTPYRLVGTFNGTNRTLYVNGVNVGTAGTGNPTGLTTGKIAQRPSGGGLYTTGLVTEFGLWSRCMTSSDVWADYDPATRWDLYWVPGRRVFFDVGAAAAAGNPWYAYAQM